MHSPPGEKKFCPYSEEGGISNKDRPTVLGGLAHDAPLRREKTSRTSRRKKNQSKKSGVSVSQNLPEDLAQPQDPEASPKTILDLTSKREKKDTLKVYEQR